MTNGTRSVEATVELAAGITMPADEDLTALLGRVKGSLGKTLDGSTEGSVMLSDQWVSYGDKHGWQADIGGGFRFGSPDTGNFVVEIGGGPHWVIYQPTNDYVFGMLALDATIGYGFQAEDFQRETGVLLGLSLTLRRDALSPWSMRPH